MELAQEIILGFIAIALSLFIIFWMVIILCALVSLLVLLWGGRRSAFQIEEEDNSEKIYTIKISYLAAEPISQINSQQIIFRFGSVA